jgi:hypothetical protein
MKIKNLDECNMKYLIIFLSIFSIVIATIYYLNINLSNNKISRLINKNYYLKISENYVYIINNNIAQYSSYIIIDRTKIPNYRIEAFIKLNYKYVLDYGDLNNFICLIKFSNKIIKLDTVDSPKITAKSVRKLVYEITFEVNNEDLNNAVVAIIWKNDFNESLEMSEFIRKLDHSSLKLPYSLIKFQKPKIINTIEPRLPGVAFCIHYTYSVSSQIFDWFDRHLLFGVSQIFIYDAIENNTLTKLIKDRYGKDNRITVLPYQISFNDLCNETLLFEQYIDISTELKNYLLKQCEDFYNQEYLEKYKKRNQHEPVTSNDCFTVLREKYEFIGHYDLDEFVFPRSLDSLQDFHDINASYSCKNKTEICSSNIMTNNYKAMSKSSFYNYLNYLIDTFKNERNIKNLASINFKHAILVIPNENQTNLIKNLEKILTQSSIIKFPAEISYGDHTFIIEESDMSHVRYLKKFYDELISCANNDYFKNISILDENLIRYLYYVTEGNERLGKSIHYYKNVKSIWIHGTKSVKKNSWYLSPPYLNGHFLHHNRQKYTARKFVGTIRKLNIDFEYVFFLLKNYTTYCE